MYVAGNVSGIVYEYICNRLYCERNTFLKRQWESEFGFVNNGDSPFGRIMIKMISFIGEKLLKFASVYV